MSQEKRMSSESLKQSQIFKDFVDVDMSERLVQRKGVQAWSLAAATTEK